MTKRHGNSGIYACLAALALLFAGLCMSPSAGFAADKLRVRAGTHDTYTRFVFDWEVRPGYTVNQDGDIVRIVFDRDSSPDFNPVFQQGPKALLDIKSEQDGPKRTTVVLTVDGVEKVRDFYLGSKVVLDVHHRETGQRSVASAAPKKTPAPAASPQPKPVETPRAKPEPEPPARKVADKPEITAQPRGKPEPQPAARKVDDRPAPGRPRAAEKPAPAEQADAGDDRPTPETAQTVDTLPAKASKRSKKAALRSEPERRKILIRGETVMTVSQADDASLGVFQRHGDLWVVVGRDRLGAAPQVKGYLGKYLGTPTFVNGDRGVAYRYRMPPGAKVRIESGDLTWRIILSDKTTNVHSISLNEEFAEDKPEGEGQDALVAPFESPAQPVSFVDPEIGDRLIVVPVRRAMERVNESRRLTNFEIIPAFLGMALREVGNDVGVELDTSLPEKGGGARILVPGGIRMSARADRLVKGIGEGRKLAKNRLFDFARWSQGGLYLVPTNVTVILNRIAENPDGVDPQDLFTLAKLYISNNMGHEARGALRLMQQESPAVVDNADYIALRGVAQALAGNYDAAVADLSLPVLENEIEARIWRGFAAARAEKWGMAGETFPDQYQFIAHYPGTLGPPVGLHMAESVLRNGNPAVAGDIISFVSDNWRYLRPNEEAMLRFLKGEIQHQMGNDDEALKIWKGLVTGNDRLYRAKASFEAVNLKLELGRITLDEAIAELDRLRYAWRGDGLEIRTLLRLGELYFQNGQYREGFNTLRNTAAIADEAWEREEITGRMTSEFARLYVQGGADELSPLEALALYNEFSELTPAGPEGDRAIHQLAERMVQVDLLDQAADLLEHQIDFRLKGEEAARIGARLASILLLDDQPRRALDALEKSGISGLDKDLSAQRRMLTARAHSLMGQPGEAISVLNGMNSEDAWRLRTDIYWRARQWAKAADALGWLNARAKPAPDGGMSKEHASMVLNQAVALTLAGDLAGIVKLRKEFGDKMEKTEHAPVFRIVTRSPKPGTLADRNTLQALVKEVDLFDGFLQENARANTGG